MDFYPRIVSSNGYGWHCNFHFGYDHDVLEDAINEKSCVQALRHLIARANAEILDLEDELAILQCQLKWSESDEQRDPYEICCATFKQKINFLTKSLKNVKKKYILDEYDMDTSQNQAPAERIYDIISILIEQNFRAFDEQVEDLSSETNLLVNSGSVDIRVEKETTLESCTESQELTMDFERQYEPAVTVSEESCTDTARYAVRDSIEARDIRKTDVKVTGKSEDDVHDCSPTGEIGFLTFLQVYNNNGNSKSNALQHEEFEECMTGGKTSGSGSSPASSKTELIVKVEDECFDASIQHDGAGSLCKMLDHKSEDPVEDQVMKKIHSPSVVEDIHLTYARKRSGLCSILKPLGQKVHRKNCIAMRRSNLSLMVKPQRKIGKKQIPSNAATFGHSNAPSRQVKESYHSLPETIWQRNPGDIVHGNLSGLLGGKKQEELHGASGESASILSQEVEISMEDGLLTKGNLASKSEKELVIALGIPCIEGVASLLDSSPANPHFIEGKSIVEAVETKGSLAYDIESLRLKLSQDSNCLNKMRVPELKELLKLYKVRGLSKFKKEKMIEELKRQLRET